jgi:hypothetical protein
MSGAIQYPCSAFQSLMTMLSGVINSKIHTLQVKKNSNGRIGDLALAVELKASTLLVQLFT